MYDMTQCSPFSLVLSPSTSYRIPSYFNAIEKPLLIAMRSEALFRPAEPGGSAN